MTDVSENAHQTFIYYSIWLYAFKLYIFPFSSPGGFIIFACPYFFSSFYNQYPFSISSNSLCSGAYQAVDCTVCTCIWMWNVLTKSEIMRSNITYIVDWLLSFFFFDILVLFNIMRKMWPFIGHSSMKLKETRIFKVIINPHKYTHTFIF